VVRRFVHHYVSQIFGYCQFHTAERLSVDDLTGTGS
jgi:hypothetical protein